MDKETTVEELKLLTKKFMDDRDWRQFHNPKDLAITISTESAELLEIFRFKSEDEIKELLISDKKIEIEDELADIVLNVCRFAEMNNIDISSALKRKIAKSELKYPIDKCKGKNKKYNEYK